MKIISSKQKNLLKKSVDEMSNSEEQFVFMIYKKKNGEDNITQYSWNMPEEKIVYYLLKAIKDREKNFQLNKTMEDKKLK